MAVKDKSTKPCYCCKTVHKQNAEADKFVTHGDRTVCLRHAGIKQWHDEELIKEGPKE